MKSTKKQKHMYHAMVVPWHGTRYHDQDGNYDSTTPSRPGIYISRSRKNLLNGTWPTALLHVKSKTNYLRVSEAAFSEVIVLVS